MLSKISMEVFRSRNGSILTQMNAKCIRFSPYMDHDVLAFAAIFVIMPMIRSL